MKKRLLLTAVLFIAVAGGIAAAPSDSASQSCGLCKKNPRGECVLPTIDNECGCCPTGGGEIWP
jgi:hypothetical protein